MRKDVRSHDVWAGFRWFPGWIVYRRRAVLFGHLSGSSPAEKRMAHRVEDVDLCGCSDRNGLFIRRPFGRMYGRYFNGAIPGCFASVSAYQIEGREHRNACSFRYIVYFPLSGRTVCKGARHLACQHHCIWAAVDFVIIHLGQPSGSIFEKRW